MGRCSMMSSDSLQVKRLLTFYKDLTIAKCNSATRPEECRSIFDAVKCIYFNGSCEKLDPFVSYKQPFLSFVKNESPKGAIQCKNTPLRYSIFIFFYYHFSRQALQSCEDQKDCTSCTSQSECGWCASGDQCLQRDADCVDGQMILTTYQKCPASIDVPPPRPCSMSNDCHSCKLLSHCNWFTVDNKNVCISLEEQGRGILHLFQFSIICRNPSGGATFPRVRKIN